jgi:hypothetical protein
MTLLVGYPIAYGMAARADAWRPTLLMLVILPFWTSFLIRVYSWKAILAQEGLSQPDPHGAGGDLRAAHHPQHQHRRLYRHRLHLPAVHGAAALRRRSTGSTRACWKRRKTWAARGSRPSG